MNEIKKIAKILDEAECVEDALFVDFDGMAKALVNAGYGDVKQAVREFAEKVIRLVKGLNVMIEGDEAHNALDEVLDKINELAEVTGE